MPKFTAYHGDLKLILRITGVSEPAKIIETDEGDGIDIFGRQHKVTKECYQEWINQLKIIIENLEKELKDESR